MKETGLANFRLGNEERENKYWMHEREKVCRVCMSGKETLEHIVKECKDRIENDWNITDILNADGRGIVALKEIVRIRSQKFIESKEKEYQIV